MIKSTIIYFSAFLLSIACAYLYQMNGANTKHYFVRWKDRIIPLPNPLNGLYYLSVLFPPVFLGTVRFGIGTDFFNYLARFYILEKQVRMEGVIATLASSKEPLYTLMNLVSDFVFPNQEWGIFLLSSLLILVPVLLTLDYFREYLSIPMGLFMYYMYYYLVGYNTLRQMIAVSIVLYSFRFLVDKQPGKYLTTIIIATLFHNTALLSTVFYLINFGKRGTSVIKNIILYLVILVSPILIIPAISVVSKIPVLSAYITSHDLAFSGFSLFYLVDLIPTLVPLIFFRKNIKEKEEKFEALLNLSLLIVPLTILSAFQSWAFRLKYYISILSIILVPLGIGSIKNRYERVLMYLLFVLFYLLYFVGIFIITGTDEAFPYESILPFLSSGNIIRN